MVWEMQWAVPALGQAETLPQDHRKYQLLLNWTSFSCRHDECSPILTSVGHQCQYNPTGVSDYLHDQGGCGKCNASAIIANQSIRSPHLEWSFSIMQVSFKVCAFKTPAILHVITNLLNLIWIILRWFPHNIRAIMAKIKLPKNPLSMVIFSIKVRRSYGDLSSQADPARENWTWSYPYFS